MKWPQATGPNAQNSPSPWLWMLSLFLVCLGARLWLIQKFGTALPFWDQWEESRVVYIPYFEGKLSLADLFSAHNEHRILFTRIYGLVLLLLNGQWDGQLQMVANAAIHCATLTGLGWWMCRRVAIRYWIWIWLSLVLVLALPFGWENSLAGFQSQFYFLLIFSLLTLWLLGLHSPGSPRWWCGTVTAILALFTVASGFLAAAAVFALAALRICRRPQDWRPQVATLAVCAAVIMAGLLLKVDVPHHHLLQAHSAGEFLTALGANLAWPWIVIPPFALLNLLPLAVLAWSYLRTRESNQGNEMTLALGLWAILQGAAAAYARGADGKPPGWRYMDSSSFILIANCCAIGVLLSHPWLARPAGNHAPFSIFRRSSWPAFPVRPVLLVAFSLWGLACAAGLALLTARAWQIDIPERELYYRAQLKHTRAFLATDDPRVFDNKPKSQIPYYQGNPLAPRLRYEAEWTVEYLRKPLIRDILPACARLPLAVQPDPAATTGFVTNGVRLARAEPTTELAWGSWSAQGPAETGTFESLPIQKSRLPYLEIPVAGALGEQNLSLELVESSTGRSISVKPRHAPGDKWLNCHVKAPSDEFKLVAHDTSKTSWFAFKAPRELGRLSYWSIQIAAAWRYLLFAGLGLFLFNLAKLCRRCPGPAQRITTK